MFCFERISTRGFGFGLGARGWSTALACCVASVLSGCGGDGGGPDTPPTPVPTTAPTAGPTVQPTVRPTAQPNPPVPGQVLSPNTIVLSRSPGGSDSVVAKTPTSLTLSGVRSDIKPGKVVLSTFGTGFLRLVRSVQVVGNTTVLQTDQASLNQAFDRLDVKVHPAFNRSTIGNIQTGVPGLTLNWVPSASPAQRTARGHNAVGVEYNKLEIDFSRIGDPKKGVSLSDAKGIYISGKATFDADPVFECALGRDAGALLPLIKTFRSGLGVNLGGSLTITSEFGGELSARRTYLDKDIGTPIIVGFLVFVPHLKIESSITGSSSGALVHTQGANVAASAYLSYAKGTGFTTTKSLVPTMSARETGVESSFGLGITPLAITYSVNLYGIVGPFGEINAAVSAKGTKTQKNSVEGIDAVVKAGFNGKIGLSASTPKLLSGLLEASFTPVAVPLEGPQVELFHEFFPFKGTSSISVGDNGPAPDDIFRVAVDGTVLGQTDKGGTGAFRVTSLRPGSHTLTITCLDDGDNGNDVGTLGIALSNGFTFSGGGVTKSDTLAQGAVRNFTIIVPSSTPTSSAASFAAPAIPRNTTVRESPPKP